MKRKIEGKYVKNEPFTWTNDAKAALAERKRLNKLFSKKKYAKVFFKTETQVGREESIDFQHKHMKEWIQDVNSSTFKLSTTPKRHKVTKEKKPSLVTKTRKASLSEQNMIILKSLGYKPRKTKNRLDSQIPQQTDNLNCKQRRNNKTKGKYRRIKKAA